MRRWDGIYWCLGAFAIYLLGWSYSREADILKGVPRINQLSELEKLLDSEATPLVVGISGRVCSETPIKCEFGGLQGVVVEQMVEQKFLRRDDHGHWKRDSELMLSTCKEVPWYLDDGTGRVNVVGAQAASGFNFPAESGVFEEPRRWLHSETKRFLTSEVIDYQRGLKLLGVKRTERVLPIGTSLSVVGEPVKDGVATIRIQKPHKGPFYVSPQTIDELITSHRNWARFLMYASFGLAVIGLASFSNGFHEYILERKRRLDLQGSQGSAIAGSSFTAVHVSDGTNSCVICLEQEYSVVFVPCGHMCCCKTCSLHLTNCPICRRPIQQGVNAFQA